MSIKHLIFVRRASLPPEGCGWAVDLYSKTGKWLGCSWARTKAEAQKIAKKIRRRGY